MSSIFRLNFYINYDLPRVQYQSLADMDVFSLSLANFLARYLALASLISAAVVCLAYLCLTPSAGFSGLESFGFTSKKSSGMFLSELNGFVFILLCVSSS